MCGKISGAEIIRAEISGAEISGAEILGENYKGGGKPLPYPVRTSLF